ncbi:MAG: hypothetical protein V1800_18585 [Candidatus Latescibacterota bacterium]
MHSYLDIRTLSFISGIISLILCICMVHVFHSRKTYSGFGHWAAASFLNCFGSIFLGMRGIFPDFVSVVIANTLLVAASGLIAYGIEIFVDSTRRRGIFLSLAVGLFVSFIYFAYLSPNVNARIIIISAMLAMFSGYSAYIVHHHIPQLLDDQHVMLTTVFGIQAVSFALRTLATTFLEGPIVDFMQASAFHGVAFVVLFGGNIFVVMGLIILNFQRVEKDLLTAMGEVRILQGLITICSSCKQIRDDKGIWNQIETYTAPPKILVHITDREDGLF